MGHASEASCAAAVGSLPSVRQSSALVVGPIDFVRRAEAASETPKNNLERAAANPAARSRRAAQGEHLNKHSNSNPPRSRPAPAAASPDSHHKL